MIRTLKKIIVGLLSETLVVIGILFVLYLILTWLGIPTRINTQQSITLEFSDASQLAPGSPVRWMGADVGYVESVQPDKNHVVVKMRTEPGTPRIPEGSHFTVEFNGMAGAKSLEITQPENKQLHQGVLVKGYDVQKPIRLQDVQDTSILVAEGLRYSLDNIRESLEEIDRQMPLNKQVDLVSHDIKAFTADLDRFDKRLSVVEKVMSEDTADVVGALDSFNKMLGRDVHVPKEFGQKQKNAFHEFNAATENLGNWFQSDGLQETLNNLNAGQSKLFKSLESLTKINIPLDVLQNWQAKSSSIPPESMQKILLEVKARSEELKKNTAKLAK